MPVDRRRARAPSVRAADATPSISPFYRRRRRSSGKPCAVDHPVSCVLRNEAAREGLKIRSRGRGAINYRRRTA